MRAPWAVPGLGRPLRDPQALQEAVQEARAHPRADLCLLPGSSCGLLVSETSDCKEAQHMASQKILKEKELEPKGCEMKCGPDFYHVL